MPDERRWTIHRIWFQEDGLRAGVWYLGEPPEILPGPGQRIERVVVVPAGSPSGEGLTSAEAQALLNEGFGAPAHVYESARAKLRAALARQDDDGTDHG